jgi:hypothetical protein
MSKLYRNSAPPAGTFQPLRNTRLYGDRDTQIATASLAQRGTPNPDRAIMPSRKRSTLRAERDQRDHVAHLQKAQTAMLTAQRAVRAAKMAGASDDERAKLADVARKRRAEYLKLTGGVESRAVDVNTGASSWDEVK